MRRPWREATAAAASPAGRSANAATPACCSRHGPPRSGRRPARGHCAGVPAARAAHCERRSARGRRSHLRGEPPPRTSARRSPRSSPTAAQPPRLRVEPSSRDSATSPRPPSRATAVTDRPRQERTSPSCRWRHIAFGSAPPRFARVDLARGPFAPRSPRGSEPRRAGQRPKRPRATRCRGGGMTGRVLDLRPPVDVAASEPWLPKRDLAAHLSLSIRWVEYRVSEGMPHRVIGGRLRFRPRKWKVGSTNEPRGPHERVASRTADGASRSTTRPSDEADRSGRMPLAGRPRQRRTTRWPAARPRAARPSGRSPPAGRTSSRGRRHRRTSTTPSGSSAAPSSTAAGASTPSRSPTPGPGRSSARGTCRP